MTKSDDKSCQNIKRRDILRGVALSGAAASTGLVSACGQSDAEKVSKANELSEKITTKTIAEAEKLIGLSLTPNERQMMLAGLEQGLEGVKRLHAMEFPNDLAPATVFEPRVPGRSYKSQKNNVILQNTYDAPLPDNDADIAFASAAQQGAWIRAGAINSTRLTEIYLARIEQHAASLECFVTITPEVALEQARKADSDFAEGRYRSPLHGIPYGLKDLADVENGRTTWGATPYKDRIAQGDAEVVRKLERAGAVLLGKTTCGALAYGDQWFDGRTRNPWNTQEGSSGSSAGSASATAAGLCAFSIGTETLGSIVSPSERCGATGLRPTFGRVSRAGFMALCWSLDKVGPICRTVEDNALVLAEINGYDRDDPSAARYGFGYDGTADIANMTVGYVPSWFEQGDDTDRAALEALRGLGVKLVEFEFPQTNFESLLAIVLIESAAAFSDLTLSNRDDELVWQDPEAWPNSWRQSRFYSAVDYVQVDRLRRRAMIEMANAFDGFDALIGPHYAGGALLATNCTGHPQLAMRAGFTQTSSRLGGNDTDGQGQTATTHRVPRGISLWADLFQEGKILALGAALERKMNVASERPLEYR